MRARGCSFQSNKTPRGFNDWDKQDLAHPEQHRFDFQRLSGTSLLEKDSEILEPIDLELEETTKGKILSTLKQMARQAVAPNLPEL